MFQFLLHISIKCEPLALHRLCFSVCAVSRWTPRLQFRRATPQHVLHLVELSFDGELPTRWRILIGFFRLEYVIQFVNFVGILQYPLGVSKCTLVLAVLRENARQYHTFSHADHSKLVSWCLLHHEIVYTAT